MMDRFDIVAVRLWGLDVGVLSWDRQKKYSSFEYQPEFIGQPLAISPITVPNRAGIYSFSATHKKSFHGLPGFLSDCLPDSLGLVLTRAWLKTQRREVNSNPVELLQILGQRAMGALEFQPVVGPKMMKATLFNTQQFLESIDAVLLADRQKKKNDDQNFDTRGINDVIRVSGMVSGAQAKAVISLEQETGDLYAGQGSLPVGCEHWLIKFDKYYIEAGMCEDRNELSKTEYAYYLMAKEAGIDVTETRLREEEVGTCLLSKRFDRTDEGDKVHTVSLNGLAEFGYRQSGIYSYEQAFKVMESLHIPISEQAELFRRMVFNVVAHNQNDHTKKIIFCMDKKGEWKLAPVFGLTYADHSGHHMTINNKTEKFQYEDLATVAKRAGIPRYQRQIEQVCEAVNNWRVCSQQAGLALRTRVNIAKNHHLIVGQKNPYLRLVKKSA